LQFSIFNLHFSIFNFQFLLFTHHSSASSLSSRHSVSFMALVQFKYGSRAGESVALEKDKTIVGRHKSCDCVIMHPMVSRKHFCVERNAGKFFLVDLESGNGTLVNGNRVSWVELNDGDNIQVGPFTLVFLTSERRQSDAASKGPEPAK